MKMLPRKIQQQVKSVVYKKADEHGYIRRDRIANGIFMENLIKDPLVGGVLSEYMSKPRLKTYIKDAVLNRYAKDQIAAELDSEKGNLIRQFFSMDSMEIPTDAGWRLSMHKLDNGDIVVVSCGTLIKWETALRKGLELIAKSPGLGGSGKKTHLLLQIAAVGRALPDSDRLHLEKCLGFVGVKIAFVDGAPA